MQNALSVSSGPPPAPNPSPEIQGQGNALASPQAAAAANPAPTHQQTVAAMRQFSAVEKELSGLLANPDVGKTDMHSQIIDGTTKLVASGIMTAAQAVQLLGTVPERPFDQKQWLEQHFMNTIQASTAVLAHHGQAFAGMGPSSDLSHPDDHHTHMAALIRHYKGAGNG